MGLQNLGSWFDSTCPCQVGNYKIRTVNSVLISLWHRGIRTEAYNYSKMVTNAE